MEFQEVPDCLRNITILIANVDMDVKIVPMQKKGTTACNYTSLHGISMLESQPVKLKVVGKLVNVHKKPV